MSEKIFVYFFPYDSHVVKKEGLIASSENKPFHLVSFAVKEQYSWERNERNTVNIEKTEHRKRKYHRDMNT